MSRINKIWTDLNELTTNAQVLNYWENRQARILETLKSTNSDFEIATQVIHRLAKSLNDREEYSAVYYLYKAGFLPIEDKLPKTEDLNELKFELGRGLHHNRKYDHSKRLFNDLASSDFDTSRIDGWWNQSAFASTRDKYWLKTGLLPPIVRFAFFIAYVFIVLKTQQFLISTVLLIILLEINRTWWYKYRLSLYLKDYEDLPETIEIKKKLKKKILIELWVSFLFFPIYFMKQEWLLPLVLIVAIYFQGFHFGLNYLYLPKLIGDLNRKSTTRQHAV